MFPTINMNRASTQQSNQVRNHLAFRPQLSVSGIVTVTMCIGHNCGWRTCPKNDPEVPIGIPSLVSNKCAPIESALQKFTDKLRRSNTAATARAVGHVSGWNSARAQRKKDFMNAGKILLYLMQLASCRPPGFVRIGCPPTVGAVGCIILAATGRVSLSITTLCSSPRSTS
jgi:hypothetical protein